jgi:hypothetical protein
MLRLKALAKLIRRRFILDMARNDQKQKPISLALPTNDDFWQAAGEVIDELSKGDRRNLFLLALRDSLLPLVLRLKRDTTLPMDIVLAAVDTKNSLQTRLIKLDAEMSGFGGETEAETDEVGDKTTIDGIDSTESESKDAVAKVLDQW